MTILFVQVGNILGIAEQAVRKRCKKLHIYDFVQDKRKALGETVIENRHSQKEVVSLFLETLSAKYVSEKLGMNVCAVRAAKNNAGIKQKSIEWSKTTCHIIGTDLYFRTAADAGNWIAEKHADFLALSIGARSLRIVRAMQSKTEVFGYVFEYVKENEYFDIIEKHRVISYNYQEEYTVPIQISEDGIEN